MRKIEIKSTVELHDDYGAFSSQEVELFQAAKTAHLTAYAPYSNFHVGAAVLLDDGQIFKGNNQENAAYPSGLCAERVALFYAKSQFPDATVKAVAVTIDHGKVEEDDGDDIISPCGGCRQVIAEYEYAQQEDIKIFLLGRGEKVCIIPSMKQLMPLLFSGDILKKYQK